MAIDPKEDPFDENPKKEGKSKKTLLIGIVAVVAIIGIVAAVVLTNPGTTGGNPTDVTLGTVYGDVEVIKEWKATQMEDFDNLQSAFEDWESALEDLDIPPDRLTTITDINDKVIALETQVEGLALWSSNISTLEADLGNLKTTVLAIQGTIIDIQNELKDFGATVLAIEGEVSDLQTGVETLEGGYATLATALAEVESAVDTIEANLTALEAAIDTRLDALEARPRYIAVTGINDTELYVTVSGAGNYPVVVTLYGNSLSTGKVSMETGYSIDEHCYGASSILAVFIEPVSGWDTTDEFILNLGVLTVDYATASVGAK